MQRKNKLTNQRNVSSKKLGGRFLCLTLAFTVACNRSKSNLNASVTSRDLGTFSPKTLANLHKKIKADPNSQWVTTKWRKTTWADLERLYTAQHLDASDVTAAIGGVKISNHSNLNTKYKEAFASINALGSPSSIMSALHLKRDSFTPELIEKSVKVVKDSQQMSADRLKALPPAELIKIQKATAVLFDAAGFIYIQAKNPTPKAGLKLAEATENVQRQKSQNQLGQMLPFLGLMGMQLATMLMITTSAQKSRGDLVFGKSGQVVGNRGMANVSKNRTGASKSDKGKDDGANDDDWNDDWQDQTEEDAESTNGDGVQQSKAKNESSDHSSDNAGDETGTAEHVGVEKPSVEYASGDSSGADYTAGDNGGADYGGGDSGGFDFGGGDFGGGDFGGDD